MLWMTTVGNTNESAKSHTLLSERFKTDVDSATKLLDQMSSDWSHLKQACLLLLVNLHILVRGGAEQVREGV